MEILIRRQNKKIELFYNEKVVEVFDFENQITLEGLFNLLFANEFQKAIILKNEIDDLNGAEKELFNIIEKVIDDYNSKKIEFDAFVTAESQVSE